MPTFDIIGGVAVTMVAAIVIAALSMVMKRDVSGGVMLPGS
jgi:hypothetical protein